MQYSDDAQIEFRLNSYSNKGSALAALGLIKYKGGNTKTGNVRCHPNIPSSKSDIFQSYLPVDKSLKHFPPFLALKCLDDMTSLRRVDLS